MKHFPAKALASIWNSFLKDLRVFGAVTLFAWSSSYLSAQADTAWQRAPVVTLCGYVEAYYAYDFNEPQGNSRQPFFYNFNRHNEFGVNLAMVTADLQHSRYRGTVSLQAGTYANDNYAGAQGTFKNVFEAHLGIALDKRARWWVEAGIMPSHIGFESAIGIDNATLTRSLLAENSPYFLTGARLTFEQSEKWTYTAWISNGWQRIQRLPGNSLMGFGTAITYAPDKRTTLNWSTYAGSEFPDSTRRYRYFSNLYGIFDVGSRIQLTLGFDIGIQQHTTAKGAYDFWYSPIAIAQYRFNPRWRAAIRGEYYEDKAGVIVPGANGFGFQTSSASANVDFSPTPRLMCRLELRQLLAINRQFISEEGFTDSDFCVAASIGLRF